jgi:hypothetical protein
MSSERKITREEFERMCDEVLPLTVKPKPPISQPEREPAEVLKLDPWRKSSKPWNVQPSDRTTSYIAMEPTAVEKEIMRAVGQAARQRRVRALSDPLNLYGGGEESIDDVVRRQDETR